MGGRGARIPRRTLPRSIYISAPLIAVRLHRGHRAVLWLVPTGEVNIVSGFLQAIAVGAGDIGLGARLARPRSRRRCT